ncbi:MAG: ABC transporter substrate-binding protein, partial [Actinomycetota bacterium]
NTATSGLVFTSLEQQGLFYSARIITGLANTAAYPITGTLFEGSNPFITNSYFPNLSKNKVATDLASDYRAQGKSQDLFTPDGVNAAFMIVRALKGNSSLDVDQMISSLEGYKFLGIKGNLEVRARDHVLVQPMYIVRMVKTGNTWGPELVKTIFNVAP